MDNGGRQVAAVTNFGQQPIRCLALSPDYAGDDTLLAANIDGRVYYSDDGGGSFTPLPAGAAAPPLDGSITVAFDADFSHNQTVYAAGDSFGSGVYRFVIGRSDAWEAVGGSLPSGAMVSGLAASADGLLYAADCCQLDSDDGEGGLGRCLSAGSAFEITCCGLDDGTTLIGLWSCGNRLWSLDTSHNRLMTYYDGLTQPVELAWLQHHSSGVGTILSGGITGVRLEWQALDGASRYQWQIDDDSNFSVVPDGFEGTTGATSVRLSELEAATTYYWRVRAIQPVASPWSEVWSFTTSLGDGIDAPQLHSPAAGALGVPIQPVFQWSAVAGAEGYELVVSSTIDFSRQDISKTVDDALPGNAWQADIALSYGNTYYWRVRAVSPQSNSAWSAVGIFVTRTAPQMADGIQATQGLDGRTTTTQTVVITTMPGTPSNTADVAATVTTTVTVEPPPTQGPPPEPGSVVPQWLYLVLACSGAIIAVLLAVILVLAARGRRYMRG